MTRIIQQLDQFTYIGDENPNTWLSGTKGSKYIDFNNNLFYKYVSDKVWEVFPVKPDYNATSGLSQILNKPVIPAAQIQTDWVATTGMASIQNKPMVGKAMVGLTIKDSSFRVYKNSTVASGVAIFYLTDDNTSTGNALYTDVYQDSIQLIVNDPLASYQFGYVFSNSNKTLTVTCNKLTTANLLSGVLGQAQANGAIVKLSIEGK